MGALFDGFEAARQKREAVIAERHRKEEIVDHELHELIALLEQDGDFLKKNGVGYEIINRTMRVSHQRSPVVTIHYGPDDKKYVMTVMHDGSHATLDSVADCARAIGETLFAIIAGK
jgi:hypothetical protein